MKTTILNKIAIGLIASIMMNSISYAESSTTTKVTLSQAMEDIKHKKYKKSLKEFEILAEKGNVDAQVFLAFLYSHGTLEEPLNDEIKKNIPYNEKLALKWLKKSSKNDFESMYQLGLVYSTGKLGVNKNEKEALKYYQEASKKGHSSAMYNIGNMYKDGRGGLKINYKKAIQHYKDAEKTTYEIGKYLGKNTHHSKAIYNTGYLYYQGGHGIKRNLHLAYKYFKQASIYGENDGLIAMMALCKENPSLKECK